MAMVDVTIYGAGIFGLSIAWTCAQRGARVVVADPGGPGAGASGGIVGALAPHVPEKWDAKKAFQLDSLLMAQEFWAGVARAGGRDPGYGRTGRLQPVADARGLALARQRSDDSATLWHGAAHWQVIAAEKAGPWHPPSPTGWLIQDTLTARMHPRQAVAALVAALNSLGVTVIPQARPKGAVIWANGADGLRQLSEETGQLVGNAVKGQAALLDFDAGSEAPQLFVDGMHFIPHADGTLAVGSTSERYFEDATTTDTALEDLVLKAQTAMPAIAGARVIERWAGLRPRAKSRAPVLGPYPGRPGHFVANGGFKIGFGMSPKIAEVMADLVLDGKDGVPPDFRIETCL